MGAMAAALSVRTLVDATPASRDRVVDALRALAIGVVVLWHWTLSVTQWSPSGQLRMPNPVGDVPLLWLATWVFQVMPLFFVVGGVANLAAWERACERANVDASATRGGEGAGAFLRSRLSRLGRPIGVFLLVWGVVEALALAVGAPSTLHWGQVVFVPLWFLATYAAVVVLVPLTAAAHHRFGVLVPVVLGAGLVLTDLGRFRLGVEALGYLTTALVWVFAHQLGYWWRDGTLPRAGRRGAMALVVGGLTALVVLTSLGAHPRSMVAVRGEDVSNMWPTTAAIAALAVLQTGLALLARPALARWLERRGPWSAVVAVNGVAMTVFTWHMTALVLAIGAWHLLGGTLAAEPTAMWWLGRPVWVVLPALALVPLVALFRRWER